MNQEEFDSAVSQARQRQRAYEQGLRNGMKFAERQAPPGCLLPIVCCLLLIFLVTGCMKCDCGWLTGPVYCDENTQAGYTWAYLPSHDDVTEWMTNIIGHPVDCPDAQLMDVCGIESITTVMKPNGWIMVHADLILCLPALPTPAP